MLLCTVTLGGVTSIEVSTAVFNVSVALPCIPEAGSVAVIVVVTVLPVFKAFANPFDPAVLLIVATVRSLEVQAMLFVKSCVLPSL